MATITEPRAIGRRNLLRYACGCAVGGAGLLASGPFLTPARASGPVMPSVTPDEALARLKEGNERYIAGRGTADNVNTSFSPEDAKLAKGQQPNSCILGCADSRVIPEFVFNKGKGQLFTMRNAGNLAGHQAIASAEYAVEFLGCALIVVMGHSGCGAVQGAIDLLTHDAQLPGMLPEVIAPIGAAVARARRYGGDLVEQTVIENVRHNVAVLTSQPPVLSRAVNKGRLKVVGAVYQLETGRVNFLS